MEAGRYGWEWWLRWRRHEHRWFISFHQTPVTCRSVLSVEIHSRAASAVWSQVYVVAVCCCIARHKKWSLPLHPFFYAIVSHEWWVQERIKNYHRQLYIEIRMRTGVMKRTALVTTPYTLLVTLSNQTRDLQRYALLLLWVWQCILQRHDQLDNEQSIMIHCSVLRREGLRAWQCGK